jgi:hypothetical protein
VAMLLGRLLPPIPMSDFELTRRNTRLTSHYRSPRTHLYCPPLRRNRQPSCLRPYDVAGVHDHSILHTVLGNALGTIAAAYHHVRT